MESAASFVESEILLLISSTFAEDSTTAVIIAAASFTMALPFSIAETVPSIMFVVFCAASPDLAARLRTSSATTAKPFPASPARAASIAALGARIMRESHTLLFSFQSKEDVLRTTEQLRSDGYTIAGEPRTSGDGYFESVILDPDGNRVECVYRKEETGNEPDAPIETERLLLRPFRESDAEAFFKCCQNPNIGNNAGWKPHDSLEESQEILRSVFISQSGIWAIILKEDRRLIGSVGIIPDPKRENPQARMLGYWLDESHWGKGYMTEAVQSVLDYGFNTLQLSLITANCYPHNERSQHGLDTPRLSCFTENEKTRSG